MATPANITIHMDVPALTAGLREMKPEVDKAVVKAMKRAGAQVEKFGRLRLSGPASKRRLGIGHGHLRRSWRVGRIMRKAGNPELAIGTNLPYGRVHEFGIDKVVNGRAHIRKGSAVRSHRRHMRMPERPFARPAARDANPIVQKIFAGAIHAATAESMRKGKALGKAQFGSATSATGFRSSARRTGP